MELKLATRRKRRARTLLRSVSLEGVGIHSGERSKIVVKPSGRAGIVFRVRGVEIPARHEFVVSTTLSTDLGRGGVRVRTVEHLMAAFYLAGVDAALVELVGGEELPILDGSALEFFKAIKRAGVKEISDPVRVLRIARPLRVRSDRAEATLKPYRGERFVYEGNFPRLGRIRVVHEGEPKEALLGARTFCRREDVELLRKNNYGRGGSLINTLVLDEEKTNLVYRAEPAYHKLLDLIGDLALIGARIEGEVISKGGGHSLNHLIREEILKHFAREP